MDVAQLRLQIVEDQIRFQGTWYLRIYLTTTLKNFQFNPKTEENRNQTAKERMVITTNNKIQVQYRDIGYNDC